MDSGMQREDEMISFIDEVNKDIQARNQITRMENSPKVKRKILEGEKAKGREICLDTIFNKIYKDALPITPEFKEIHGSELDKDFQGFIQDKAPKGLEYYVRESIKKGNRTGKVLLESVDALVKDVFFETGLNLNAVDTGDIKFDSKSDEVQNGLQEITDKMGAEDIAEIIKENVKQAAIADIERQKKRDEETKAIVDELKNDPSVTTEAVLDRKLALSGITTKRMYTPTLFEGIMVNKTNLFKESEEELSPEDIGKMAFFESVKEMTKLSVLHNLGVFPIGLKDSKKLAKDYASMRVPESRITPFQEAEEVKDNFLLHRKPDTISDNDQEE